MYSSAYVEPGYLDPGYTVDTPLYVMSGMDVKLKPERVVAGLGSFVFSGQNVSMYKGSAANMAYDYITCGRKRHKR